ncbi:hypothetical protein PR202_gb21328 [Eleusine coracana subsp. coracana]|uniref:Uncharacterized protein n=1 Tax=Eleusine coracana subsp. coracana TaxID=191504 RepID=A0AAV5FDN8_ELECO|nr:hypothetical protein PR202_gb21328 [Eleusine coracana subsp. coracana]
MTVGFHQRHWIMLPSRFNINCRRRFVNVSTEDCIHVGITDLRRLYSLGRTTESFLMPCQMGPTSFSSSSRSQGWHYFDTTTDTQRAEATRSRVQSGSPTFCNVELSLRDEAGALVNCTRTPDIVLVLVPGRSINP